MTRPIWITATYIALGALGIIALVVLTALSISDSAAKTAAIGAVAISASTTMAVRAATQRQDGRHSGSRGKKTEGP